MKKIVLILYALTAGLRVPAQEPLNKDSLLRQLSLVKSDTEKVDLYLGIGDQYMLTDIPLAKQYYRLGGELSKKASYREGIFRYYAAFSDALARQGFFDSSLVQNLESVEWSKKMRDSLHQALTLVNTGVSYWRLDDFENAVNYFEEGKSIYSLIGNMQYEGQIDDMLQNLARAMHQYRKAVNYGLAAVDKLKRFGNRALLAYAYNNVGLNYIHLNMYDSAKYYLEKSAAMLPPDSDILIPATNSLNMGFVYWKQENYDSLKVYADKALQFSRKHGMPEYEGFALWGLGHYYLYKKNYASAKECADTGLAIANRHNFRDQRLKQLKLLSSIAYGMQDTKLGSHYANLSESLGDSILNESVTKNTIITEKKFETQKKETQIKLQQTQLRQKTTLNYFLIAGAAALLIISLLTYRNYRNRQRWQQARIDELETERQLTATEAVLKGEERERTRLAKDLHDGLGGMLSGIKYSLSSMKTNLLMTPENMHTFERNIDMLDSSIREMRRVAHNMMPEILVKYGLDAAFREFCGEIDRSGVLRVAYQSIDMDKAEIEQTTAVTIYRIVQELVNNAIRHAGAENVLVQTHVSAQEKLLMLTVEDDGKGLDTAMLKKSSGMGWSNIQHRVEFLKGKIDINSDKGKGTSVLIEITI